MKAYIEIEREGNTLLVELEGKWCKYFRATHFDPEEGGYIEIESAKVVEVEKGDENWVGKEIELTAEEERKAQEYFG